MHSLDFRFWHLDLAVVKISWNLEREVCCYLNRWVFSQEFSRGLVISENCKGNWSAALPDPFNRSQGFCDSWNLGPCVPQALKKTIQCIAHVLFPLPDKWIFFLNIFCLWNPRVDSRSGPCFPFFSPLWSDHTLLALCKPDWVAGSWFVVASRVYGLFKWFVNGRLLLDRYYLSGVALDWNSGIYMCNFNVTVGKSVSDMFFLINPLILIVFGDRTHSPHIISLSHFRLQKKTKWVLFHHIKVVLLLPTHAPISYVRLPLWSWSSVLKEWKGNA